MPEAPPPTNPAAGRAIGDPLIITARNQAGLPVPGIPVRLGTRYACTDVRGEALFLGLKEGEHELAIDAADFCPVRKTLEIGRDCRNFGIVLQSFRFGGVRGRVTLGRAGIPLPNAVVTLTPRHPAEMGACELRLRSDWDGIYESRFVPPGEYTYSVEAAHCRPSQGTCAIAAEQATLDHELSHVPDPVRITVNVRQEDGSPMGRCRVRLLEGMGAVTVAEKEATGSCVFEDLERAPFTGSAREGLPFISPEFVVTAEAEGFHPAHVTGSVRHEAECEVDLVCSPNREPVDLPWLEDGGEPARIPLDEKAKVGLPKGGKERLFTVSLPHDGQLQITAGPNPFNTHLRLLDDGLKVLHETWNYANHAAQIVAQARAGELFIGVRGDTGDAEDPSSTLIAAFQPVIDAYSWNDGPEDAVPLRAGEAAHSFLFPRNDAAYFVVEVAEPGLLRARLKRSAINTALRFFDPRGEKIAETWNYANCDLDLSSQVYQPGPYRIGVQATSPAETFALTPHVLRVDFLGSGATPSDFSATSVEAVELPFGRWVSDSLFPARRIARYRLRTEIGGHLKLRAQLAECNTQITLRDGKEQRIYQSWNYAGNGITGDIPIQAAGVYEVEVASTAGDTSSFRPFALAVFFYPDDEYEGLQGNDGPETAPEIHFQQVVSGCIARPGDVDVFRFYADQPGLLRLRTGPLPINLSFTLMQGDGKTLHSTWHYAGNIIDPEVHLPAPGAYLVRVQGTQADAYSSTAYSFTIDLLRVRPPQGTSGGVFPLPLDTGLRLDALMPGHGYRFNVPVEKAGRVQIGVRPPVNAQLVVADATGQERYSRWNYAGTVLQADVDVESPTTLQCTLRATSGDTWSKEPYFAYATLGPPPPEAILSIESIEADNRTVLFQVGATPPEGQTLALHEMDFEGGGRFRKVKPGLVKHRYEDGRIQAPRLRVTDSRGAVGLERCFVDLRDVVLDRLSCRVLFPEDGAVVASPEKVRARAGTGPGRPVQEMCLYLDGRLLARSSQAGIEADLDWTSLAPGDHSLKVTAASAGETAEHGVTFRVSDVFGLWPDNGQVLTGTRAFVTWSSPGVGASVVEYRKSGDSAWQRRTGARGRSHRVVLDDLELGVPYELRAGDGEVFSELRTLTLQKGLAFERPRYGATIPRAYGQILPVTVRNHLDQPMEVVLECIHPKDGELLVGFVGDGSQDRPVRLEPGAARQFALSLSAQDCLQELHHFTVGIRSTSGYSDQAEVEVRVLIPRVELAWEELETRPDTLSKRLRLVNRGDGLTDLAVTTEPAGAFRLRPAINHALLEAGGALELWVDPVLTDGFTRVSGELRAQALGRTIARPIECAVPEGQRVFRVTVDPTVCDALSAWYCTNRPMLQLMLAQLSFLEKSLLGEKLRSIDQAGKVFQWLKELRSLYDQQAEYRRLARLLLKEVPFYQNTDFGRYLTGLIRQMGIDGWIKQILSEGEPGPMPWNQGKCDIFASVGKRGSKATNHKDDVLAVQRRLAGLGFSWVKQTGTMDFETEWAIQLFQAMVLVKGTGGADRAFACRTHQTRVNAYLKDPTAAQPQACTCGLCSSGAKRFDGVISVKGPTLKWLQALNAPSWVEFPAGRGSLGYEFSSTETSKRWGSSWMRDVNAGAIAYYVANRFGPAAAEYFLKTWTGQGKGAVYPAPVRLTEVSTPYGGNRFYKKSIGHQAGMDVDVGVLRKDGRAQGTTWNNKKEYDQDAMEVLIKGYLRDPRVKKILFNDPKFLDKKFYEPFSDPKNPKSVEQCAGHDNHMHVVILPPDRIDPGATEKQ